MKYARITGTGFYVPPKVITNFDLEKVYDTSDEWIVERSGIKERRYIDWETKEEGPADLALPAVQMALKNAGYHFEDMDLCIFATLSPEAYFPGSGCFLQALVSPESTIPMLDIRMQCSGFLYGMSIAEMYIKAGKYQKILLVGSEVQSTTLDLRRDEGRAVGVLFGDGAGAVVIEATDEPSGILSTHLYTQGKYAQSLWVPEPTTKRRPKVNPNMEGLYPQMNGREVFKHAVTRMTESILEACKTQNWTPEEVNVFLIHQANARIIEAIAKQLAQPIEKFFINIHKYGNTTAATIPICMHEALEQNFMKKGDKVIVATFGSGFTWGSAALIW
jgi:3-oxoacyl-[acyl-carrier-protein] synthase-3